MLKPKIPDFFEGIKIEPTLLHGDLRAENVGQTDSNPGLNYFQYIMNSVEKR